MRRDIVRICKKSSKIWIRSNDVDCDWNNIELTHNKYLLLCTYVKIVTSIYNDEQLQSPA